MAALSTALAAGRAHHRCAGGAGSCSLGRMPFGAPAPAASSTAGRSGRSTQVGEALRGRGSAVRPLAASQQNSGKGDSDPYRKTVWDGEASSAGMWDGWPEGPSCSLVHDDYTSIDTEELERLETLYKKARDTYMAGSPLVTDAFFDKMEARLKELDSEVVRKWPRCSVLKRRMYSDIRMDSAQLSALGGIWAVFLLVGGLLVLGAGFALFMLEDPVLPSTLVAGLTIAGLGLGAVAARSLLSVSTGGILALKGECPSCAEEVYSFLQLAEHKEGEESKLHCNCHVCNKPLVFQARVASSGPGGLIKVASGRVYLIPDESDFFPAAPAEQPSTPAVRRS